MAQHFVFYILKSTPARKKYTTTGCVVVINMSYDDYQVEGVHGLKRLTRLTREIGVSKEGEGGGEEERKDVTIAGRTDKRTNEQGKIGLLSQWTMEG